MEFLFPIPEAAPVITTTRSSNRLTGPYFTTIGLTGLPTAFVTGSGDASRKKE